MILSGKEIKSRIGDEIFIDPYDEKRELDNRRLVLIGGDGSGYDYGEKDWYRLAFEFKNINTTFVNSRRTPKFAWKNLKENSGPNHKFLDLEDTPFERLQEAIDSHSHIFVTADSTSMIVEILTRGYFVNVVELRGPIKREHHHEVIESFKKRGLLRILKLNQLQLSTLLYRWQGNDQAQFGLLFRNMQNFSSFESSQNLFL